MIPWLSLTMIAAQTSPAGQPPLVATGVLFLILLGTLGLLAMLTLIRWSLRRAGRIERTAKDRDVPESAWKMAGKRAIPADNDADAGDDE